jgi:hypothetical protein
MPRALGWGGQTVEPVKQEKRKKLYFKAKTFKFENIYQSFDKDHDCMRMMDFEIAVCDPQLISDLEII